MATQKTTSQNLKKVILPIALICVLAAAAVLTAVFTAQKKESYRLIKVNSFDGMVKIQRENDETFDAFEGLKLVSADMVDVSDNSFLELLADDDKHIGAEENTGFVLHSSGTSESGNITIELLYGKALFTIDEKLNENSFFEVKTPNATLSVRGTSFSVEYNEATGETTVEVFEGTVWASYYGTEQILEKDDILKIGPNSENSENGNNIDAVQIEEPIELKYEGIPDFMISRYYPNVADYQNVPAEKLEFCFCDSSKTNTALAIPDNLNTDNLNPLAKSTLEIDEKFIEPVMDKVNALFEERKDEIIRQYAEGVYSDPIDITEFFKDLESREVTVNSVDSSYSFEFSTVILNWVYSESIASPDSSYEVFLPSSYIDDNGNQYSIVAVTFTFYNGGVSSTGNTALTPPPPETAAPSLTAVNDVNPAEELLFYIYRDYKNVPDYASAEARIGFKVLAEQYKEEQWYGYIYSDSKKLPDEALSDSLYEIENNYIEPHKAEISQYFDENKATALDAFKNNKSIDNTKNVTDWFPETITLSGEKGAYTYHITGVDMQCWSFGNDFIDFTPDTGIFPSDCYIDGDFYVYTCGVDFQVKGYIE
ncbi:MAG: FecR domain-containing protein [Oscillospiraceae bacterium]